MIEVSMIVVNYHARKWVERLKKSIPKNKRYELIVIDNDRHNRGFGKACNLGAQRAKGKYLLFLNPDTRLFSKTIVKLRDCFQRDTNIGMVGPQLVDTNGQAYLSCTKQPSWIESFVVYSFLNTLFPNNRYSKSYWYKKYSLNISREVASMSGAAMMLPKNVFEEVGGFDERFFLYWEDFDLCRRVINAGYTLWYCHEAKVEHTRGGSTQQNTQNRWRFRHARYAYFLKYFGRMKAISLETWLTFQEEWRLVLILGLAAFLRTDRLATLMPLIGDQGRDFLAAYHGLQQRQLPLLGIPSSVPRFSQGPVYLWWLMLLMSLFGTDPYWLGLGAALLGVAAVAGTYLLAERYSNRLVAVLASLILATAPLAVTQARLAFHPNMIPLVTVWFLWRILKRPRQWLDYLWLGVSFGVLFELELATIPLILLVIAYTWWWEKRKHFFWKNGAYTLLGVMVGLLPKLVYDVGHRFSQVGVFGVWMVYRVVSLFGYGGDHTLTFGRFGGYLKKLDTYLGRYLMWGWESGRWIAYGLMMVGGLMILFRRWRLTRLSAWVWLWLGVVGIGFMVHSAPSEAYFPVLFVPLAIVLGMVINQLNGKAKWLGVVIVAVGSMFNAVFLGQHDYLVGTAKNMALGGPVAYGAPLATQKEVVHLIASKAHGEPVALAGVGPGSEFASFLDGYRYLLLISGVKTEPDAVTRVWMIQGTQENYLIPGAIMYDVSGIRIGIGR